MKPRWGILISGRGSNLAALLDLGDEIDVRLVVSSSAQAQGLLRARRAGVSTELAPVAAGTKKIDWAALDALLRARGISHIFLAGFMKVLPASFVDRWTGRILNLHPSLLPNYPGLNSIERAHTDRADMGLSVHLVTAEVDSGRVLCRRRCLKADEVRGYSLDQAEFLVHVDEQRTVKEAIRRWNLAPTP